jgi:tRNA modification GTPase
VYTLDIIKTISPHARIAPHSQSLSSIIDQAGVVIDRAMIAFHPGPNSYTGEDLVEISCHGNPLVVDRIMEAVSSTGLARLAHKGEFTRKAFFNGKMDLIQAEAVGALIGSSSTSGCSMAHAMLGGELSHRVRAMREDLLALLADIEASFITEDESVDRDAVLNKLTETGSQISELLKDTTRQRTSMTAS